MGFKFGSRISHPRVSGRLADRLGKVCMDRAEQEVAARPVMEAGFVP
jgi:hypothetical protein